MQQALPWIVTLAIVAIAAVGLTLWRLATRRASQRPLPVEWALTARPVFSADERRVYRQLREALPQHIVLAKLPLVRLCQPSDPDRVRYWYELLGGVHLTFAICSANGRVLAALDLDNDRHNSRRVLQIKQGVLGACRVRYLRCSPDMLPSIPELQMLVPQSTTGPRGPQPAPVLAPTPTPSTSRRKEAGVLWHDSGMFQDSFFGAPLRRDTGSSSEFSPFGSLRGGRLDPDADEQVPSVNPPTQH